MNPLRLLLILASIALPILFVSEFQEHHQGKTPFETLYYHVVPARLVKHVEGAHVEHVADAHEVDEHGEGEHAADGHADEQAHSAHGSEAHVVEPSLFEIPLPSFLGLFDGNPHKDGVQLVMYNAQPFQLAAILLIFLIFLAVPVYIRSGGALTDKLSSVFSGFCMWIRDEMVYPVMGAEEGKKYLPFFFSLFFFVLFMNLLGLVPGSATATASIFVTLALAVITLFSMVGCGMVVQGPVAFWKNLVPHVPAFLWPLMFVVEVVGLIVKPFALMIRLFANMTGGHLVVLSFMGLIFFFAERMGSGAGYGVSPIAIGFAVFIMIIEGFVAMLQAYIFTQLSVLFVGASVHPDH